MPNPSLISTVTTPPSPKPILFFFNTNTATSEIYTLSLHDALPISKGNFLDVPAVSNGGREKCLIADVFLAVDRKSTRLNSSHPSISYAVFCLKKKKSSQEVQPDQKIHRDDLQKRSFEPRQNKHTGK